MALDCESFPFSEIGAGFALQNRRIFFTIIHDLLQIFNMMSVFYVMPLISVSFFYFETAAFSFFPAGMQ